MKKLLISMALASAAIAAPVVAQTLPPAVIVVVDMDEVVSSSAAGKQAQTDLKARFDSLQSRLQSLRTSFGAEEQALIKSRPAGAAATPAAITAWETKAKDFQTRKTQAEQDLAKREQDFNDSRAYVIKQIQDGAAPIITAVMKERGASIAMPELATLQHIAGIDVTADVIARVDKALPRVSTTAPPRPAGAAAPK